MFIDRRKLPHDTPWWLDPTRETYFITICGLPRGENQLARQSTWEGLLESVLFREQRGEWHCPLLLAMPDHLHALLGFAGQSGPSKVIKNWKGWTAKRHGITWQDGFFEHRLRTWESCEEKRNYILANPVRAGLCDTPDDWPFCRDLRGGK